MPHHYVALRCVRSEPGQRHITTEKCCASLRTYVCLCLHTFRPRPQAGAPLVSSIMHSCTDCGEVRGSITESAFPRAAFGVPFGCVRSYPGVCGSAI